MTTCPSTRRSRGAIAPSIVAGTPQDPETAFDFQRDWRFEGPAAPKGACPSGSRWSSRAAPAGPSAPLPVDDDRSAAHEPDRMRATA